jgi:hypothetical protein
MTTKTKKPASKKPAKATKKAAPKMKAAVDSTPVADPCAKGHKWDTDAEGVEHCTVCLADRKVIEKEVKKKGAKATKKAKPVKAEAKMSALNAVAQVLASSKEPLNTKQMIERMAAKGLWTSPGGATPWATLYSATLRDPGEGEGSSV